MSATAAWSYTAEATHWPLQERSDWDGARTWGAPAVFPCDYSSAAERVTDAQGVEFIARQTIYTERATIQPGDYVLIGAFPSQADPVAAGALEVRLVARDADVFDRLADDFKVVC